MAQTQTTAAATLASGPDGGAEVPIVLSFDVEEHDRIEAAAGLPFSPAGRADYARRADAVTRWLLDELGLREIKATFYLVGELARDNPGLARRVADDGHEVASHSWDHRRVGRLSPEEFRADVRKCKDVLEQLTGAAVVGYRAPTFSLGKKTPWAIDILAEEGYRHDSSVYPVRHDRYGDPAAPRAPFFLRGRERALLEIPPLTWRCLGQNLPVGGGGYFRLFPLALMERGFAQARRDLRPAVSMIYFHPWEFDPDQPRLPLTRGNRFRTYVGLRRARERLLWLLDRHRFTRAVDVAADLERTHPSLPTHDLGG